MFTEGQIMDMTERGLIVSIRLVQTRIADVSSVALQILSIFDGIGSASLVALLQGARVSLVLVFKLLKYLACA